MIAIICNSVALANYSPIVIQNSGSTHDHSEHYIPADMPEVYYDSDNLEIILVADGFSSYYDVDIFQTGYTIPVITTQVDGYGDTIDISSLPDGNYTIVITSEFNNVFEGQFIVNWQNYALFQGRNRAFYENCM